MSKLLASGRSTLARRDLASLTGPEERRDAERAAETFGRALRDRCSRRRRPSSAGARIDLRRMLRRAPARGGEPIDIVRSKRKDPPLALVALLDVSGSMSGHARTLLAFLRGLVSSDTRSHVFLFHTRLLEVTRPLAGADLQREADRLSLMIEGFGGGTRIGESLAVFNRSHARRVLTRRSAVLILSDGFDSGTSEQLDAELTRLRKRARRVIWLDPLKGEGAYVPFSTGMRTALPHVDAHLPARSLSDLAGLKPELERL